MAPVDPTSGPALTRRWAMLAATLRRPAVLTGLILVGSSALAFIGWAALASVSFERTDASQFQGWGAQPLGTGGGIALGCCIVGLVFWFLSRRYARLLAVAGIAIVAGGALLVWGAAGHAGRAHPEYDRARALRSLEMPLRYISGPTQLDHPSELLAPAATRAWTTTLPLTRACSDLAVALAAWADRTSVRTLGPTGNRQRCYISASKGGHRVDANAIMGVDRVTVSVRLAG